MKQITFAFGIFVAVAACSISMSAQAGRTTAAGVYTDAQAARGKTVYNEQCSFCHGDDLKGSDVIPALTGASFQTTFKDKTLADVYNKVNTTMPATAPGSLTAQQTADVIAFILSIGKSPAGMAELPAKPDELKTIGFVAP